MEVIPLSSTLSVLGVALWCVWAAYTCPENPIYQGFPTSLPFLPPLRNRPPFSVWLLLHTDSPSAYSQLSICGADSLQVCQSPAPSPTSETRTPPWPVDPVAPPWLTAPSSLLWPVSPPATPGSLVLLAPPWSVVNLPSPWDYSPPASPCPSGSSLPPSSSILVLCRFSSTAAFRIPA